MNIVTVIMIAFGVTALGLALIGYFIIRLVNKPFLRKHCLDHIGEDKQHRRSKKEYSIEEIYGLLKEFYKNHADDERKIELIKIKALIGGVNVNINLLLGLIASMIISIVVLVIIEQNLESMLLMLPVGLLGYSYIHFFTKAVFYEICIIVLE